MLICGAFVDDSFFAFQLNAHLERLGGVISKEGDESDDNSILSLIDAGESEEDDYSVSLQCSEEQTASMSGEYMRRPAMKMGVTR